MRKSICSIGLLVLFACGGSTEPGGKDPDLLITNNLDHDAVSVVWQDGTTIFGTETIPPRTTRCVRFLAQPDSARWVITATETNINGVGPATSTLGGNFFNPEDRPAWEITVMSQYPASPIIRAVEVPLEDAC